MKKEKNTGISSFQRYLTVWVFLCMIVGVLLGHFVPALPAFLNRFEYARISIPMAVLIWVMIYPMMLKVDFQSIRNVGHNPKGLFVTWIVNWLVKPFTMYGISCLFFFVIFKGFITPELATEYMAGGILTRIFIIKSKGTEYFEKVLKINNIKHINFHSLRHTFATNCILLGVDYKTVSELLGHANVNITLNLYVHPRMSQKKKCIDLVSKVFQEKVN